MSDDRLAKMKARDKAMRLARDEILCQVGDWLRANNFVQVGAGHFTQVRGNFICRIGFQKLTSGRSLRVMCHITRVDDALFSLSGPWSDEFERPNSPGKKYNFSWGTHEADIDRSVEEYCAYVSHVAFAWFDNQVTLDKK